MTAITIRRIPSRALTLMEPFDRPWSLLEDVDRWARDVWESWIPVTYGPTHAHPRLDMWEDKDNLYMKFELPGIRKEDIEVSLEEGCLTVKAEKKMEELSEEATSYTCERSYGTYTRTITLPFAVDADKISSTFENGLLEIMLPKAETAKPKKIEVKVK